MSFRFGMRDLLISTTLIAFGLGSIVVAIRYMWLWWLGFFTLPLLGAGGFRLFNRLWIGVAVGCLLNILIPAGLLLLYLLGPF